MISKKIFETSIFITNTLIFIWGTICFNDYRSYIETTLSVPENVYSNRSFFIIFLNIIGSMGSIMTFCSNFGRDGRAVFYFINCVITVYLGSINIINYRYCDSKCISLLSGNQFSSADLLVRYLSMFQLFLLMEYLCLAVCIFIKKRSTLNMSPLIEPGEYETIYD